MKRKAYASDLNDAEWDLLKSHIPAAQKGGRPRTSEMREVVNAIFYVLKTGCQWEMLPHDFRAKGTVYHYYNTWRKSGLWQQINAAVRAELRQELGREASPSAAIIASQSVQTTEKGAFVATMPTRKSRDANAISSSIAKASS